MGVPAHTSARLVGSRLVGRWPSGAPTVREPDQENTKLADDDCANNNFEFQNGEPKPPAAMTSGFRIEIGNC